MTNIDLIIRLLRDADRSQGNASLMDDAAKPLILSLPWLPVAALFVGLEAYSEGREHYLETHHYAGYGVILDGGRRTDSTSPLPAPVSGDAAFRKNAGISKPQVVTSPTKPRMSEKERIAWLNSPFNY